MSTHDNVVPYPGLSDLIDILYEKNKNLPIRRSPWIVTEIARCQIISDWYQHRFAHWGNSIHYLMTGCDSQIVAGDRLGRAPILLAGGCSSYAWEWTGPCERCGWERRGEECGLRIEELCGLVIKIHFNVLWPQQQMGTMTIAEWESRATDGNGNRKAVLLLKRKPTLYWDSYWSAIWKWGAMLWAVYSF